MNIFKKLSKALLSLTAGTVMATAAAAQGPANHLVNVEWLEANLDRPDLLLIDASPTPLYVKGHIQGAISISFPHEESVSQGLNVSYGGGGDYYFDTTAPYAWQEAPRATFQAAYEDWGIDESKTIVIYDQGGTFFATRLFYSLFYHNFPLDKVYVLDGGLHKWQAQGYEVTTEVFKPAQKGGFRIKEENNTIKATLEEFVNAGRDPEANALVEALWHRQHTGAVRAYSKVGHIPHAISAPFHDFFNEDRTFKSPAEIQRMLDYLGIGRDQVIYTHCGGGIAGSVPFFAIKVLAQYPDVRHSTESQMGYLHDPRDLPFWTYSAPYLMRDTQWLQWWGGQRTRTLGSIHVSILDVRSQDDYKSGHIPFALSVPAEEVKASLTDRSKLAALLGKAGVNPAHEAVIVSGGRVDKDAALAYLALEALGQKKVSIYNDAIEDWAARGHALSDQDTVVAPQTIRFDVNVPPVEYAPEAPRKDVLITDPASTQGLYPRVYLASGKELPASLPEGKVVHVPYTELLDTDGRPKAADVIAKVLEDAGLSRYAEVVAVSDDISEAAVNYYALKLLGYPDLKVLAL
ncbi:MAG: rhodanese-like domain-containing protein [Burkholderiaceae bacterium]